MFSSSKYNLHEVSLEIIFRLYLAITKRTTQVDITLEKYLQSSPIGVKFVGKNIALHFQRAPVVGNYNLGIRLRACRRVKTYRRRRDNNANDLRKKPKMKTDFSYPK